MSYDVRKESNSESLMKTIALVTGAHIIMILTDGATLSFGIFLTDFANELNVGLGVIGAASSLLTSVQHALSPVAAHIASKIGYRKTIVVGTSMIAVGFMISSQVQTTWQLFISHSAITGFGASLVYANTITFVGLACGKHISIANGVTLAGTAVGLITVPLLINILRGVYGWRGSLLLLGGIVLHSTLLSLVIFRSPQTTRAIAESSERNGEYAKVHLDDDECMIERNYNNVEENIDENQVSGENGANVQEIKTIEIIKEYLRLPVTYPLLGFLMIVANLIFLAYAGTLYHLVSSAIKSGISESKATILMTTFGIGNIISRMLHGVPIKFKLITTSNLFAISLLLSAVSTFALPFCETYNLLASATLIIGLSVGTCIPLIYLLTREIVGVDDFPKAMGILLFTTGFAGVVAGFFTGLIYDVSGSYNIAFCIMGSLFFVACFFLVIPRVYLNYKKSRVVNINVNSETIGLDSMSTPKGGGAAL